MMSNAVPKVTGAPESIWLCYGPLTRDLTHPKYYSPYDDDEITWHERSIYSSDVKYVRADMVEEAMYVISRLLAYAQDVLSDPDQLKQFKKGVVERDVASALALISKAEGVLDDCD